MKLRLTTLTALTALFSAHAANAQPPGAPAFGQPVQPGQPIVGQPITGQPGTGPIVGQPATAAPKAAYFSPVLGAHFQITNITLDNFGSIAAAQIVSTPMTGSPLATLGLTVGDSITSIDAERATELHVLEAHNRNTTVKFVKNGATVVSQPGNVFITPNKFFKAKRRGTFSARLGAYLLQRPHTFTGFAPVTVYEVVSAPQPGSPLTQLRLTVGSIITRFNGANITAATSTETLSGLVPVRFAKDGATLADGKMFVNANLSFSDGSSSSSNQPGPGPNTPVVP